MPNTDRQSSTNLCEQHGCALPARARVFWPGSKPLHFCQEHTDSARTVNEAISGGYLHIEALPGFVEIEIPNAHDETDEGEGPGDVDDAEG